MIRILLAPAEFSFSSRAGSKPGWFYFYLKALLRREVAVTAIFDNIDDQTAFTHPRLRIVYRRRGFHPRPSIFEAALFHIWLLWKAARLRRGESFEVIHHFGNFGDRTSFNLPFLFGVFGKKPFVIGPLEEAVSTADRRWGWISYPEKLLVGVAHRFLLKRLVAATVGKSSAVICLGPTAAQFFSRIAKRKYFVIPPGVEVLGPKREYKDKAGAVRLITVCRLNKLKRVDLLLRVFFRLLESYPALRFCVVGDGPERPALERRVAARGLRQQVSFCGRRPHRETLSLLAQSDIYLNASVYESFGQATLEAMARGLPVVATDTPGSRLLVEDGKTGFIIPRGENEEEALREKLLLLVENPDLIRTFGERARARVKEKFLWDKIVKRYLDIYSGLNY